MPIDTKTVENRRDVSYQNYDDLLADAEKLAGKEIETRGNWTFGQILRKHFNLRHAELHMSFVVAKE